MKYMRILRSAVVLGCLLSSLTIFTALPAYAGDRCYTRVEAEAEQGIRIHSELMVIGLNCMHMPSSDGKNLYIKHQEFTAKNQKLFADYEKIMMEYMRLNGDKNPEQALHSIRTNFANKISNDVATMRPDIFCKTYAERIEKVSKMDGTALRKWASTPFAGHPVSRPMCKK
jgi:hypothetical protein